MKHVNSAHSEKPENTGPKPSDFSIRAKKPLTVNKMAAAYDLSLREYSNANLMKKLKMLEDYFDISRKQNKLLTDKYVEYASLVDRLGEGNNVLRIRAFTRNTAEKKTVKYT